MLARSSATPANGQGQGEGEITPPGVPTFSSSALVSVSSQLGLDLRLTDLQPDLSAAAGSRTALASRWSRGAGATGSLFFVALFLLLPLGVEDYTRLDYWTFENSLAWVSLPFLGWLTARLAHALVADEARDLVPRLYPVGCPRAPAPRSS